MDRERVVEGSGDSASCNIHRLTSADLELTDVKVTPEHQLYYDDMQLVQSYTWVPFSVKPRRPNCSSHNAS